MALLLFLHSDDPERLRSALALAAATAATDETVTLVWEGPALRALSRGALACSTETPPPGVDPAASLHAALCECPTVRNLACPTAVAAVGLSCDLVADHVDAVLGLTQILEETRGARALYV